MDALRKRDYAALTSLPISLLHSGTSEIGAYRSRALTGVGLCFARWR
jgi:hypothetical protein